MSEQPSEEVTEPPAEPAVPEPAPEPVAVPVETQAWQDAVVRLESLTLRLQAIEDAICNLQGFQRAADGSQQGRIIFSRLPEGQLPAIAKAGS